MKITAIIADERRPEGWQELYMARHRRRNVSEHATRDEAIAALEAIKAQQSKA